MPNAILIGSTAIKHYFHDFRAPKDCDIICDKDFLEYLEKFFDTEAFLKRDGHYSLNPKSHRLIEVWLDDCESNKKILNSGCSKFQTKFGEISVPPLSILMTIKRSHLYWPLNWNKHIEDYHFLKNKGVKIDEEILKLRTKEHIDRLGESRVNLNMPNELFFEKSSKVGRRYDHDDLHLATCYYDKPLFLKCKKDKSKAILSKDLFDKMNHNDKVKMAREECYALSLERRIIPRMERGEPFSAESSYSYILSRLGTTLTKGWFREFVIEHYPEIKQPDKDYVAEFVKSVKEGRIRKH